MTDILVDIGNSALKLAPFCNINRPKAFLHRDSTQLNPEVFPELKRLQPNKVFACSVANQFLQKEFEKEVAEIGASIIWYTAEKFFKGNFDLINEYDFPNRLGADRWFAALGAISEYPCRSIVLVQFGTATTVDAILFKNGQYWFLGGCILPGLQLMFSTLSERIPALQVSSGCVEEFPKNTENAISTGIISSQIGLIKAVLAKLEHLTEGKEVQTVLTGGGIESFGQLHRCAREQLPSAKVNTNLVLKGLRLKATSPV